MAIRLHELHPSLVHFPIALLPTSVAADLLGRITGDDRLHDLGRLTIPLAAVGAAFAGIAGFAAQEEVVMEHAFHHLSEGDVLPLLTERDSKGG